MLRTYLMLAAFGLAFAPAAALAGQGYDAREVVVHIFQMADTDETGTLTRTEYEDAKLQDYGVTFEQSDLDSNGETSLDEYLELYDSHHPSDDRASL